MAATLRKERKAATAAKITEAARMLFATSGYEAVSLRDVAATANVSTGAIFASFLGKEELFAAAMGRPAPTRARIVEFLAHQGREGVELAVDLYGAVL